MKVKIVLSMLVLALGLLAVTEAQGQVITSVVRAGGASGNNAPVGAHDANTQCLPMEEGGVQDGKLIRSDRTHTWANTPTVTIGPLNKPMIGSEYVRTFNNDKNVGTATYTVTLSTQAIMWIALDDRFGDEAQRQTAVDSVVSDFAPAGGTFTYAGFKLFVGGDSDRPMSVYTAELSAGTYVFGPQQSGYNFYCLGAVESDPTFNPAPVVDAKPDMISVIRLGESVQLDGVVTDEDPLEGDPGALSWEWSQASGPGTATFSDAALLNPIATFNAGGIYELMLTATDGEKDANDLVRVWVKDRADEVMLAYYPLDGNGQDASGGGRHLTAQGDTAFATGVVNQAATFDGAGDDLVQTDPNLAIGDLLNGSSAITVSCWVKSNNANTDKGFVIFQTPNGNDDRDMRYDAAGATGGGAAVLKMGLATTAGVVQVETSNNSQTTDWQHVVMTWERGGRIRGYIDGIEEVYTAQSGIVDAELTGFQSLILGRGGKDNDPNAHLKGWDGLIDEVRIYNYALPLEDDPQYESVRELTAMGPVVARADAGGDITVNWRPGLKTPINGEVLDYGRVAPMTIMWSTVSGPDDAQAQFDDPMSAATMVEFPASGTYVLKLTVIDEGLTIEDTITATVNAPTCAQALADGKVLVGDIGGPNGLGGDNRDCRVDLYDFALLAEAWLTCNDPAAPECTYPYEN